MVHKKIISESHGLVKSIKKLVPLIMTSDLKKMGLVLRAFIGLVLKGLR